MLRRIAALLLFVAVMVGIGHALAWLVYDVMPDRLATHFGALVIGLAAGAEIGRWVQRHEDRQQARRQAYGSWE